MVENGVLTWILAAFQIGFGFPNKCMNYNVRITKEFMPKIKKNDHADIH